MTSRGFYTLLAGCVLLVTALSVGSTGAFMLGCAALLALAFSFLSVILAAATCRISQTADCDRVSRREQVAYTLSVRMMSPLPVAPLSLRFCLPSGRETSFLLTARLFGETLSDNAFTCPHVGLFGIGATHVAISDCFSLFTFTRRIHAPLIPITVLPVPIETACPAFSPGEGEHSAAQRAQSDRSTPVDTRAWQDGDELKRVHWKLSMRKQSLMVHTYETRQRPDALILLDCGTPDGAASARAQLVDTLTEAAAGVIKILIEGSHPVRMPLCGKTEREVTGQDTAALPSMLEALALEPFDVPVDFARVLMLCARRMRRTGATVILSSRLTPKMADTVIALSRMGSKTQFTLITPHDLNEEQEQLLHLLVSSGVDTRHKTCES